MMEVRYIVKRQFKYGDHVYKPGEEWEPAGGKWDKQIAEHYVRMEPLAVQEVKHDKKTRSASRGSMVQH